MDCILHAYRIDKKGKATKLATDVIPPTPEIGDGFIWLHFKRTHEQTREVFLKDSLIDNTATRTLLAQDSRPRTIIRGTDALINLRGVNLNPGSQPEDMIPIRFFIQETRVISVCGHPLKATEDRVKQLNTQAVSPTPGGFIAGYALAISERMSPTIMHLNEKVDLLEEKLDNDKNESVSSKISLLRKEAIVLRRYIAPQRDALNALSMQTLSWISPDDQLRLRDASDQAARITEELDAVRERCAIVKDQITDMRAEQMNKNMMILSVVAAIFLPLGLISGMMGINVGGMPWVENASGFWIVTAIVFLTGLLQLVLFKILKWL